MTYPTAFVVVVNLNHWPDTVECVKSLQCQENIIVEIVVIDNGSNDDSVAQLRRELPDITLIETGQNLGFSGGYNVGIRFCRDRGAENILIVNNDTHAHPSMLAELVAASGPGIAAVSPLIFYDSEPTRIWSQGSKINWLLMEQSNNQGRSLAVPSAPEERDFLTGCCMLLNRKALDQVGLLDERFYPIYYEDLDFSVRLREAGWKLLLAPKAMLWHKVSLTNQGSDSPNERYLMARMSIRYFRKHVRNLKWAAVIPWRIGSAIKTSIRLISHRKLTSLKAYWRGLSDGLHDS